MNFTHTINNDIVDVLVQMSPRRRATDPKVVCNTSDVIGYLNQQNIEFERCISESIQLSNNSQHGRLSGTWRFLLKQKPKVIEVLEQPKTLGERLMEEVDKEIVNDLQPSGRHVFGHIEAQEVIRDEVDKEIIKDLQQQDIPLIPEVIKKKLTTTTKKNKEQDNS